MRGLLLLTAARTEADALRLGPATPPVGGPPSDIDRGLSLLVAGVGRGGDGPVRRWLSELRPALVVNVGFAGALEPSLAAGGLHVVNRWVDPAPPHQQSAQGSRPLAEALIAELARRSIAATSATAVTVEAPFHDAAAGVELAAASGAVLVEMEGARWASAAEEVGAAFVALRVVSDHADLRLPRPRHELLGIDGTVHWARWAGALATGHRTGGWQQQLAALRRARIDWSRALATMAALGAALPATSRTLAE